MAWVTPKTDWTIEYRADYEDFNRINGNLNHVKELADELFRSLTFFKLDDQKNNLSMLYASEMNEIETSLEILNEETYSLDIGEKQTFRPNGNTPLWSEFNRIESATLKLFELMTVQKNALNRLPFALGSQKGIVI